MRIPCPHCGLRDAEEFSYEGDATVAWPSVDAGPEAWVAAVYLREDPRGPHREVWRHAQGCGAWAVVTRNTATHEVLGAEFLHPGLAAGAASDAGSTSEGGS